MSDFNEAIQIMTGRFGRDTLISVATIEQGRPFVRTVDALYQDGAFYVVTYALSSKIRQIAANPEVAVCGEWFSGHGIGENLGHVRADGNAQIIPKLRDAFSAWYNDGDVDEDDPNTCILRIRLTDGVLFNHGTRFDIDFTNSVAS